MNNKFLPIGSVCTLKGKNKKVMITGYYGVEFNGNLKIDDYQGCSYPEGLLLPELTCNFNHSDIENIDFVGYKNDDQVKFNALLNALNGNDDEYKKDEWILSSNKSYSKLLFDENGVVVLAEPIENKKTETELKFDENGILVEYGKEKIENPFYKDFSSMEVMKSNSNKNIFSDYKFDENGILVGDDSNFYEKKESSLNEIKFDENGIVISIDNDLEKENNTKYKFDENGILASENGSEEEIPAVGPVLAEYINPSSKVVSNYMFDSNGNLTSEEIYTFNSNGNLISTNNKRIEDNIPTIDSGLSEYVSANEELESTSVKNTYTFDEDGTVTEVN